MAEDATRTKWTENESKTEKNAPKTTPARRPRWWLRIVVGILLLLIGLVALAPTLASTGVARRAIVGMVNENIRGTVAIDDISLGWFTSAKITGVHVSDGVHPETLTIGSITWDKGLLGAALSRENFGRVEIDAVVGVIYFTEDGSNSLENAFAPREQATTTAWPNQPAPDEPPPSRGESPASTSPPAPSAAPAPAAAPAKPVVFKAALAVKNSRVSLVRFDGPAVHVTDLNATVELDYPKGVTIAYTSTHDGGGKLLADVTLQNLDAGPDSIFDVLAGTVKIRTEPAIDLGPAMTFFAPPATQGQGTLKLNIDGQFAPGATSGNYRLAVQNLSLAGEQGEVKALSQEFAGTMFHKGNLLNVTSNGDGTLGKITANLDYKTDGPSMPDNLADLLMQGKSFTAPDVAFTLDGKLDLAALVRALPGIVTLQEGVAIDDGTLALENITARGGEKPATSGKMTLTAAVTRDGKATKFQPVVIGWDVLTDEQGYLHIRKSQTGVTSSFATVTVGGTIDGFESSFAADLTRLQQELAEIVDLNDMELGGTIKGTLALAMPANDPQVQTRNGINRILKLDVTADDVVAGSRVEPPAAAATTPPAGEFKDDDPTHISGTLTWQADLCYNDQKLDLKGKASIAGLKLTPTGDVLGGDAPALEHDLTLDMKNQRLDLRAFGLKSRVLKIADFKGSVTHLDTDMVLDLAGSYSAEWKELTALVDRFKPGAMEGIAMQAASAGPVTVTGPVGAPTITPLRGNTNIGWGTGSVVYGIHFGDAKLEPKIAGGVFSLPLAEIPANDGMLRLMSDVNLAGDEPMLKIPGRLHMMENIAINADMGKYLLSRAVPLLAETTKLEGTVSLMVQDIDLPLGESMMQSGSGGGRLDLAEIKLSPAGEMARLMTLIGLDASKSYPVTIGAVDFELKEGALSYDNMTVTVGGVELRIRGQVRFDDGVDLIVSVPVKREMIEALGIKGASVAKIPDGLRVDVPLVGTRQKPKLDLSKIDKEALARDVLKAAGLDLGGILGGGKSEPTTQPADTPEQKPSVLPIKLPSLPTRK